MSNENLHAKPNVKQVWLRSYINCKNASTDEAFWWTRFSLTCTSWAWNMFLLILLSHCFTFLASHTGCNRSCQCVCIPFCCPFPLHGQVRIYQMDVQIWRIDWAWPREPDLWGKYVSRKQRISPGTTGGSFALPKIKELYSSWKFKLGSNKCLAKAVFAYTYP